MSSDISGSATSSNNHHHHGGSSHLSSATLKRIAKELGELSSNPPEGILIIPNERDISDIQAWIQGPASTPFITGAFKVQIVLGPNFPSSPPSGFFLTKIFHPNVAPSTGEICVSTLKKDWTPQVTLSQLLLTIKCLLMVPNAESALNEEAGKLILEDYESYCRHARILTSIHAMKHNVEFVQVDTPAPTSTTENSTTLLDTKDLQNSNPSSASFPSAAAGVLTPKNNVGSTGTSGTSPLKRAASAGISKKALGSSKGQTANTNNSSARDKKSLKRL